MTAISYLPLSELSHKFSPYHLTNAALNIQNSRQANQRGRDADFFLFSANYVGSDSTGYIETKDIEPEVTALGPRHSDGHLRRRRCFEYGRELENNGRSRLPS